MNIPNDQKGFVLYEKYIKEQINAIRRIEPLTIDQQYEKVKIFEKKHKEFFKAKLFDRERRKSNLSFNLSRISG